MLDSKRFAKNIERWSKATQNNPTVILEADCSHISFCQTGSDEQNLCVNGDGEKIYFHSPNSAVEEAQSWMKELDLKDVKVLYIIGIGLGYYYDAVKEWLHQNSEHVLIFLEEDPAVIRRLLETDRGEEMLSDSQVSVYWLPPVATNGLFLLEKLAGTYALKEFLVSSLKYYDNKNPKNQPEVTKQLTFYKNIHAGAVMESINFGKGFFANFYSNISFLPHSYLGNGLKKKFEGVPAIICGAGPSLEKNLSTLGTLKDKALIFAGGTAMNSLNTQGVLPHFGVGIDPNWHHYLRLITNTAYEVPFFYRNRMFHTAFRTIHGDKLYVCGSIPYEVSKWFEEKYGIKEEAIEEGFNVINFSVEIAKLLGCNPIIMVGVDLAYTNNKSYMDGLVSHPLHDRKKDFRTKEVTDELVVRQDINGNPVQTLWKWVNESLWYNHFCNGNPNTAVINSTEGGLGFPGVPNINLAFVGEHILRNHYDLETRIHGEIQNNPMPAEMTVQSIIDTSSELRTSMINCRNICIALHNEYISILSLLQEGKDAPLNLVTDIILDKMSELEDEVAYKTLLAAFDEKYVQYFGQSLRALEREDNGAHTAEIARKKTEFNIKRFDFLIGNIIQNLELMDYLTQIHAPEALQMEATLKMVSATPPSSQEAPGEVYLLQNGMLKIIDPEMNLSFEQPFVPDMADITAKATGQNFVCKVDDEGRMQGQYLLHYPEGAIKYECYYLDGFLHGPSTSFSSDGKVLGRKWFFKGKAQGKARYYYSNGSLKSIQRFNDGVWDKKQEYYYANGQVRSILSYKKGLLDGDVWLYYADGKMERELHFINGKRHGYERNWNDKGLLIVEVQWDMDRHSGVARSWYDNGTMAKEITFNDKHRAEKILRWDINGTPWIEAQYDQNADYFELVSKQSNLLADSFQELIKQVGKIAPFIEPKGGKETGADSPLASKIHDDIVKLEEQLSHLREVGKKLADESGADDENQDETIWKTPSQRKEIQKQIDVVTQKMGDEILEMREKLKTAFTKLQNGSSEKPLSPKPDE